MQAVAKLIRQIREALSTENSVAPFEALAAEYSRFCHEAGQRLESCAAMLAKGSDYQTLQLAETEPPLLDLIAALSFSEAPAWLAYCQANQLAVAPKFDLKAVQALDGLYAKGINPNHPLYKDYRAAVTARDDVKALRIIRSIVRLNPQDANGKTELARIENKLVQIKLQELRPILTENDENGTLSALGELERLASPAKLSGFPEYARALEVRRGVARREAQTTAVRLLEALDEEHQAGAWRMVGDILSRLKELQKEHGFNLPGKSAVKCDEMQRYYDAQRSATEEKARFERSLTALDNLARDIDARLEAPGMLTLPEMQDLHGEFDRRWRELLNFKQPLPVDYESRVQGSDRALCEAMGKLLRGRKVKVAVIGVGIAAAVAVAAWFGFQSWRTQDYVNQLAKLREAGQVEAAEKMIANVRGRDAALAARPALAVRLDEVDQWTRDQRGQLAEIDAKLAGLESTVKQGIANADPLPLVTKMESTNQLIEKLADGLRTAPAGRMLSIHNEVTAHMSALREKLVAKADGELTDLENIAGSKLSYDQSKEVLTQALARIDPPLKALEARVTPTVAALALPAAQQDRVSALRKRVDLIRNDLASLEKVRESLLQANTLDTWLKALEAYKESKLVQTREVSESRRLLATTPKSDALLASLVLPGDTAGWIAAKADSAADMIATPPVQSGEISILLALREDKFLNSIWDVVVFELARGNTRREVYSRGELTKSVPIDADSTKWEGQIYTPGPTVDTPSFVPTTYALSRTAGGPGSGVNAACEVRVNHLSASSQCLNALELSRLTDSTGSRFEKPLLAVFNDLVRDKNASPIFKAYVMQQLARILDLRPTAWGSEYCASVRSDLAELNRLCDGVALRSHDWLLERKKAQLGGVLAGFFIGLQNRDYLGEARLHREVVRGVIKAGLQFGGFVDSDGKLNLVGEARGAKELWSLAPNGQGLVRYTPPPGAPGSVRPVAGLAPIFFVPLDREAFVSESLRKVSKAPSAQIKLPTIPWLEKP